LPFFKTSDQPSIGVRLLRPRKHLHSNRYGFVKNLPKTFGSKLNDQAMPLLLKKPERHSLGSTRILWVHYNIRQQNVLYKAGYTTAIDYR
jgi:hypothetical protein